jgi:hypothetical protein
MRFTILSLLLCLLTLTCSQDPGNLFFAVGGGDYGPRPVWAASPRFHPATVAVAAALGLRAGALAGTPLRAGPTAHPAGIAGGAVLVLQTPKACTTIALMDAQVLMPDSETSGILTIAAVFTLNNVVAFTHRTATGNRLARHVRHPRHGRRVSRAIAVLMVGNALSPRFDSGGTRA